MDNKKISKEALAELEKEKAEKTKEEFKQYFKDTLQEIEIQKKNKETIEEKIRILNKDLDDLKNGDLEKIKERQDKSELAKQTSRVVIKKMIVKVIKEPDWYKGTYPVIIPLIPSSYPVSDWTVTTCDTMKTGSTISKTFYF